MCNSLLKIWLLNHLKDCNMVTALNGRFPQTDILSHNDCFSLGWVKEVGWHGDRQEYALFQIHECWKNSWKDIDPSLLMTTNMPWWFKVNQCHAKRYSDGEGGALAGEEMHTNKAVEVYILACFSQGRKRHINIIIYYGFIIFTLYIACSTLNTHKSTVCRTGTLGRNLGHRELTYDMEFFIWTCVLWPWLFGVLILNCSVRLRKAGEVWTQSFTPVCNSRLQDILQGKLVSLLEASSS